MDAEPKRTTNYANVMPLPTCFIAMPLTTSEEAKASYHGDADHFTHVLEHLFVPAVEAAGFTAIRPIMSGADVIQGQIIKHLETADMVLCDISSHNPNVFFELGIRTALDRPVALVRDDRTDKLPFDTSIVNTHTYNGSLTPWTLSGDIHGVTKHVADTFKSTPDKNDLWGYFGLTRRASERLPSENPLEAKVDLMMSQISSLTSNAERDSRRSETDALIGRIYEIAMDMHVRIREVRTYSTAGIHVVVEDAKPIQFLREMGRLSEKYGRTITVLQPEEANVIF